MIYKTLILPILEYGDIIYDCLSAKDAATLQKLQNACLKHALQMPRLTSTAYVHETLDMEYLDIRRKHHVATQMYRINNQLAPHAVLNRFEKRSDICQRNTRTSCSNNYNIPRTKLEMSKRSFTYRRVKVWYEVPEELKFAKNPRAFRMELAKVWKHDGDVGVT